MHSQQNIKKVLGFFAVFGWSPKKCKIGVLLYCCSQVLNSVGRPSVTQAIYTLKAAKFGTKPYEICELSTGHVWSFIICALPFCKCRDKTAAVVVKFVEPLVLCDSSVRMEKFYNHHN
jgi:hypothetical protein